jgi:hypothetical protein
VPKTDVGLIQRDLGHGMRGTKGFGGEAERKQCGVSRCCGDLEPDPDRGPDLQVEVRAVVVLVEVLVE